MKKIYLTLLLSIIMATGSGVAFADKHHGHDRFRDHHEQRDRHEKKHHHGGYDHGKDVDRYFKDKRKAQKIYDREFDRRMRDMAKHASRGGSDVRVWRINADTYIVKYHKNGRWYTRRFYPNSGRYDVPGIININWSPLSSWTLLPNININIPVY